MLVVTLVTLGVPLQAAVVSTGEGQVAAVPPARDETAGPAVARTPDEHAAADSGAAKGKRDEGSVFSDEIVVTATRSEQAVADLPVSATVVSREEVERTPVLQLDDLLRAVPGVILPADSSVVEYPTRDTVSMRGLGGGRALVLLDGIPLNDSMFGYIDWSAVQLDGVERVEVVRGGSGALYGGLAMGGTIHVISRPPQDGEVAAEVSYGSYGTRQGAASAGLRLSPKVLLGVNVDAGDADGYARVPRELRQPIDGPSPWRRFSGQVQARLDLSPSVSGFVRGSFNEYDLSLGTPYSKADRQGTRFAAGLTDAALAGGEGSLHLFWQDGAYDNDNVRILDGGADGYRSNTNHGPSEVIGGSLQWNGAAGRRVPLLTLGLDARRARAASYRRNLDAAGGELSTQAAGGEQLLAGLFAEASWSPTSRLGLLAGLRVDSLRNSDGFSRLPGEDERTYAARSEVELSPRLALRYDLGHGAALRAAAYGGFGPPDLRDLYRSSAFRGQENLPNPQLGPETLVGGDVGIDWAGHRVRGQLNLFANQIDAVIASVLIREEPLRSYQPQNVGTARSRGAELFGELFLDARWSVSASYVYTDSETLDSRDRPDLVGKRIAEVPEHAANLGVTFRDRAGASVSLRAAYRSRTFQDAENLAPIDAHLVVDLFATRQLTRSLTAFGAVTNVFDEEYLADRNPTIRRGAPRQLRGGLRLRLGRAGPAADGS